MDRELDQWREELEWLRALAIRLVRDPERADELAQETALISLRRSPELDPGERSWRVGVLKKLITNRARDLARRRRRESHATPPSAPPAPGDLVEQLEVHQQITEAILALDEPHRAVVILRYFHERTSAEIARETGEPEATVRSRLQRALARLRTDLDRRFGGDRRKWAAPLVAWLALSSGGAGTVEAGQGSDAAGRWPDAPPASAPPPASLPPLSPTAIGGALVSAKKAMVAAAAVALVLAGVGWYAGGGPRDETPPALARNTTTDMGRTAPSEEPAADAPLATTAPGPAADSSRVRGSVRDRQDGHPIADAEIELAAAGAESPLATTRTDSTGEFALAVPATRALELEIRARSPRHVAAVRALSPEEIAWGDPLPPFHLSEGFPLAGVVMDTSGDPVAGASIELRGEERPSARSDASGRFELLLPRGSSVLFAQAAEGNATALVAMPRPETEPLPVRLAPGVEVTGRVVGPDGEPVDGALVLAWDPDLRWPDGRVRVPWSFVRDRTAEDGSFRLTCSALPGALRVEHRDHPDWERKDLHEVIPGPPLEIALERGCSLAGTIHVEQESTRPPIVVAELRIDQQSLPVVVSPDGRFLVTGVPADDTMGTLYFPGFLPAPVEWPAGSGVHDLGLVPLARGRELEVLVADSAGLPVAGARVRGAEPSEWPFPPELALEATDELGRAVLSGLPSDRIEVTAWAPGYAAERAVIELPGASTSHRIALALAPSIRGRLMGASGGPLAGARVTLDARDSDARYQELERWPFEDPGALLLDDVTDESGGFRFPSIVPDLALVLRLEPPGRLSEVLELGELVAGEDRDLGTIAIGGECALRVLVRDESGGPISGANIELVPAPAEGARSSSKPRKATARSSADGTAKFHDLPCGDYALSARIADRAPYADEVTLADGESAIGVTLERGAEWTVRVQDALDRSIPGQGISLVPLGPAGDGPAERGKTDADGRARFRGLASCRYRVETGGGEFVEWKGTFGSLGELPASIELEPAAQVIVRFERIPGQAEFVNAFVHLTANRKGLGHMPGSLSGGEISFAGLRAGRYELEVRAFGYPTLRRELDLVAGETVEVLYRPEPAAMQEIELHLVDRSGRPVEGVVTVFVQQPGGGGSQALPRVGKGIHRGGVPVARELLRLHIRADGFATVQVPDWKAPVGRELITLENESSVELTVFDPDGMPVEGVKVAAEQRMYVHPPIPDFETDSAGIAIVGGLSAGETRLRLRSDDSRDLGTLRVELAAGERRRIEHRIGEGRRIRGRVLRNGEPVGGWLHLHAGGVNANLELGADGTFAGVFDGEGSIDAVWSLENTRVRFDEVVIRGGELVIEFDAAESHFQLRGGFPPLSEGTLLQLSSRGRGSSSSAHVRLDGAGRGGPTLLPPGWYRVSADLPPEFELEKEFIEVRGGLVELSVLAAEIVRVRVPPESAGDCSASVVTPDGRWRNLRKLGGPALSTAEFVCPAADSDTTLPHRLLVISVAGRAPEILDISGGTPREPIEVPHHAGQNVRVLEWPGEAVPTWLRVEPLGGPPLQPALASRVWSGEYALHPLPAGRYFFRVEGADGSLLAEREVEVQSASSVRLSWEGQN